MGPGSSEGPNLAHGGCARGAALQRALAPDHADCPEAGPGALCRHAAASETGAPGGRGAKARGVLAENAAQGGQETQEADAICLIL
jgi:hypothetical protein